MTRVFSTDHFYRARAIEQDVEAKSAQSAAMLPRLADRHITGAGPLISPRVVAGLVRLIEFAAVAGLGLFIKHVYIGPMQAPGELYYLIAVVLAAAATSLVFQAADLYNIPAFHTLWWQSSRIWLGWTTAFALLVASLFFTKVGPEFSRVWLIAWYVMGACTLIAGRIALSRLVRRWAREGRLNRRAVIVGGGVEAESLIKALETQDNSDIVLCGVFDDRGPGRVAASIAGYPKLGKVTELIEFSRKTRVDLLIVTLPITAEHRLLQILRTLWVLPVDIRLSAHMCRLRFRPRSYSWIANVPFIDIADKPIADWAHLRKWLFDKLVGTLAVIGLAPVMALVALAIRLDSKGPVLFRQKRYGFNNELIEIYKFRSMYSNMSDTDATRLVTRNDARVTRVGRFIRKASLDELPQLFNVLKGELSLVGPRPHALQAKAGDQLYQDVVDGYFARHKVKPGVTGWAQINGWRGETDTQEKIQKRVEHDLYYIENWSVFLDLYILLRTPFALLKTECAY